MKSVEEHMIDENARGRQLVRVVDHAPSLLPRAPRASVTRDPLDRHYTPQWLANAIVASLDDIRPDVIVEPHVGGGSFARPCRNRWTSAVVHGVDLDPDAAGFADCTSFEVDDWLSASSGCVADLILGNPPFTGKTAIEHVRASLAVKPQICAFVLPLAYQGVGRWRALLSEHPPAWIRSIPGRPWPKSVRETAVYVWNANWHETWSKTAPLVVR